MGRYRQLPDAMSRHRKSLGHSLRASINIPIQAGAAAIAMMAMNTINDSEKLINKILTWLDSSHADQ